VPSSSRSSTPAAAGEVGAVHHVADEVRVAADQVGEDVEVLVGQSRP
jgi:hypothetical protein